MNEDTTQDIHTSAKQEKSFEEALKSLQNIVTRLESGQVPLEDSVKLYEEGTRLRLLCEKKLKNAQERIEKVIVRGDGTPENTTSF